MNAGTKRTQNFIDVFSLSTVILPRAIRPQLEPNALAAAKTFTVNVIGDGVDANPGDGLCLTSGNTCTLRAAIQEANANAGKDTINFNIPGTVTRSARIRHCQPLAKQPQLMATASPVRARTRLQMGTMPFSLIELSGVDIPSGTFTSGLNASSSGGVTTDPGTGNKPIRPRHFNGSRLSSNYSGKLYRYGFHRSYRTPEYRGWNSTGEPIPPLEVPLRNSQPHLQEMDATA